MIWTIHHSMLCCIGHIISYFKVDSAIDMVVITGRPLLAIDEIEYRVMFSSNTSPNYPITSSMVYNENLDY